MTPLEDREQYRKFGYSAPKVLKVPKLGTIIVLCVDHANSTYIAFLQTEPQVYAYGTFESEAVIALLEVMEEQEEGRVQRVIASQFVKIATD